MNRRAFTLIELLVAMAVLAIVLVMMLHVTNSVMQATRTQNQQMDSAASARRALDVLVADLGQVVINNHATILWQTNSTNLVSFLTSRRGPDANSASHRFLALRFFTNSEYQLFRSYGSVDFSELDLLEKIQTSTTNTSFAPLASGILAFRIIPKPGTGSGWATNSYNNFSLQNDWRALVTRQASWSGASTNRVKALEIWIAAVDEQNFALLESANRLAAVGSALATDPENWRQVLDAADIPPATKSSIRVLNRTVSIP